MLGLTLEGQTTVKGADVGRLVGLGGDVRATLATLRTADGQGIEFHKFHTPQATGGRRRQARGRQPGVGSSGNDRPANRSSSSGFGVAGGVAHASRFSCGSRGARGVERSRT